MVAEARVAPKSFDLLPVVKEAVLATLLTLALTIGLVGFRTFDAGGQLTFATRFDAVIMACAAVLLGRFGLALTRAGQPLPTLVGGLAAAVVLVFLLLTTDPESVEGGWLPFESTIVNWILVIIALGIAAHAGLALRRSRATVVLSQAERDAAMDRVGKQVQQVALFLGPALLVVAIAMPMMPFADRRLIDIGTLVLTYIMLGWGLNIVVGLAGLLDLGYVAFFAVGAYSYALLAQYYDASFWVCLPFAGLMAALFGILLGFPVLRLRGDYLAIVTLGFGEIIRVILLNWWWFTGGPNGIGSIPRPSFFGLPFDRARAEGDVTFHSVFGVDYSPGHRVIFLYYLILGLAMVTNFFTLRIRKLPVGRAWEALREDETAARALGINPTNTKLTAFAIGAMFGGFGGSFFAARQGFISPESFTFIESAVILAIVVLGGMGSQIGVVLAAILLIGVPEFFRELEAFRMLAFGAGMVAIMIWRPRGLLAHREPTVRLGARGTTGGPP